MPKPKRFIAVPDVLVARAAGEFKKERISVRKKATVMMHGLPVPCVLFGTSVDKGFDGFSALVGAVLGRAGVSTQYLPPDETSGGVSVFIGSQPAYESVDHDDEKDRKPYEEHPEAKKAYGAFLALISSVIGRKIVFHHGGDHTKQPLPFDPQVLHVYSNARPLGESWGKKTSKLFGHAVTVPETELTYTSQCKGRGTVADDGSGNPVVQAVGNNLFFLFPLLGWYNDKTSLLIFTSAFVVGWNAHLEELKKMRRRTSSCSKETYADAVGKWIDDNPAFWDKKIREVDLIIQRLQNELADCHKARRQYISFIESHRSLKSNVEGRARIARDYRSMRTRPDVVGIEVVDEGIHLRTAPIVIASGGKDYDVGRFTVRLAVNGAVSVWSDAPTHPKGVPHPHVDEDGVVCLGSATEPVAKLAAEYRFGDAFDLLLKWLAVGYAPELARHKIEEWPLAATEARHEAA